MDYEKLAEQFGGVPQAAPPEVDYEKLAAQFGGTPQAAPAEVDYEKLAAQFGGMPQAAPAQPLAADQSVFRQIADIPVGLTKGAVSGVRMISDAFGADSAVSKNIKGVEDYLGGLLSAQAKNDQNEVARIMKDAEDKGVMEQLKGAVKAFAVAPVDLLTQALGTSAPFLVAGISAVILNAPVAVATGVGAALGVVAGAGTIKGTIYEETKNALIAAKIPEKEAEARAQLAQEYGGKNLDMILAGAALGGLASGSGLEPAIAKMVAKKIIGDAAAKGAASEVGKEAIKQGLVRQVGVAGLKEGAPEFLQAGQEKIAENVAQQREGLDTPTFRGAVGAGALEGLAGMGLGSGVRLVQSRGEAKREAALADLAKIVGEINQPPEAQVLATTPEGRTEQLAALVADFQQKGRDRDSAELMAQQVMKDLQDAGGTTTATPNAARATELEADLINAGVDPVRAKADATRKAAEEAAGDTANVGGENAVPADTSVNAANQPSPVVSVPPVTTEGGTAAVGTTPLGGTQEVAGSTVGRTQAQPAALTTPEFTKENTPVPSDEAMRDAGLTESEIEGYKRKPDYYKFDKINKGFKYLGDFKQVTEADVAEMRDFAANSEVKYNEDKKKLDEAFYDDVPEVSSILGSDWRGSGSQANFKEDAYAALSRKHGFAARQLPSMERILARTQGATAPAAPAAPIKSTAPNFSLQEVPPADSPTGKKQWKVVSSKGELIGTYDKRADADTSIKDARAATRQAAGQQPAGRKTVLTEEQREANRKVVEARVNEQNKTVRDTKKAMADAGATVDKVFEDTFIGTDRSSNIPVSSEFAAEMEFNSERVAAIAQAMKVVNNKRLADTEAGTAAKQVLAHKSITDIERLKAENQLRIAKGLKPLTVPITRSERISPTANAFAEATSTKTDSRYLKYTQAKEALLAISKDAKSTAFEKLLANRLYFFIRTSGTNIVIVDKNTQVPNKVRTEFDAKAAGVYYKNTIYLDSKYGLNNTVFLHEALHGALNRRILKYFALSRTEQGTVANKEFGEQIIRMQTIMDTARGRYRALEMIGTLDPRFNELAKGGAFDNILEFIAYGMSHPLMQEFLFQTKGTFVPGDLQAKPSLLSKFVTNVRNFFRLGVEHQSAMNDLIIITDQLLTQTVRGKEVVETEPSAARKPAVSKQEAKLNDKLDKGEYAESVTSALGELIRMQSPDQVIGALKEMYSTLGSKSISALLPTLSTSQITGWVSDRIKHLPQINSLVERMANMRSKMLANVFSLSEPWTAFNNKYAAGGKLLARTMHYTTLSEVDPTLFRTEADALVGDVKIQELNAQIAKVNPNQVPSVKKAITQRKAVIKGAYVLWDRLGGIGNGEGQKIYGEIKGWYKDTFTLYRAILDDRIIASNVKGDINDASTPKGKLMAAIRKTYEASRTSGVYFPLMRYGRYWASIGKGKGQEFYMFESELQRNMFLRGRIAQLNKAGDKRNRNQMIEDGDADFGNDLTKLRNKSFESSKLLQEVFALIDTNKGVNNESLKDSIYQMYLLTMPEQSFRTKFIKRKGTTGFSGDALRNFARSGFSFAGQLSRLRYAPLLTNEIDSAHAALKNNPDKAKLEMFLNEVGTRVGQELTSDVEDGFASKLANGLGQAAFMYFLTAPKSAIAQLTSLPVFTLPVLASRYGAIKAAATLGSYLKVWNHSTAVKPTASGGVSFTPVSVGLSKYVQSNPVLAAAFAEAAERGVTEITRTYDLLNMAKTPSNVLNSPPQRWIATTMNLVGAMFHGSERLSREVAYMASFELAYDKAMKEGLAAGINGPAFERAVEESIRNTYESLFNYSRYDRPRIAKSPGARMVFQFKMFPQQVTAYFIRNFVGMLPFIKGNTAKKAAATQFFGTLMMTGLFAGVTGLPLYSATLAVIQGMRNAMRDDDEPFPIEEQDMDFWFRNVFLPDTFGDKWAKVIVKGPISTATNMDIASSTSLNNMWLRDTKSDPSLDNQFKEFAFNMLGPGVSMASNYFKAYDDFKKGHISEAIEKGMPIATFRGAIAAWRWNQEGIVTKNLGATMYEPDEVTGSMKFWKAFGFNPTELSLMTDANFAAKSLEINLKQKRAAILDSLNLHESKGDDEDFDRALDKAIQFSAQNPELRITSQQISESLKRRNKARMEADRGLSISDKKLRRDLLQAVEPSRP